MEKNNEIKHTAPVRTTLKALKTVYRILGEVGLDKVLNAAASAESGAQVDVQVEILPVLSGFLGDDKLTELLDAITVGKQDFDEWEIFEIAEHIKSFFVRIAGTMNGLNVSNLGKIHQAKNSNKG